MRVLVMGGTGAIGKPLIEHLIQNGHEVTITSRNSRAAHENVRLIQGDSHDMAFVKRILSENHFEAIVDFMSYSTQEFTERYNFFLENTEQYFFLSSARVYGFSDEVITEKTHRIFDEKELYPDYCCTDEYAIAKAKEEDLLINAGRTNWTIIRPYITYSSERLQLGIMEKEHWLYRALHGRTVVFTQDQINQFTTLTYAEDVSRKISELVGKKSAMGEIFQIAAFSRTQWADILRYYQVALQAATSKQVNVKIVNDADGICRILGNKYQLEFDRKHDRIFDSSKVDRLTDEKYTSAEQGIGRCIESFVSEQKKFKPINWKLEAYFDGLTHEFTPLYEIDGLKNKIRYLVFRFFPFLIK